jgi:hypothetical protein
MSNTATPLDDLFAARTLADVHTDLKDVMVDLKVKKYLISDTASRTAPSRSLG